ncbi:MAG: V-type ATP synthase subunit E [Deltaproteobacteria bacterium]|jgi:V/A-type H+-transporting ATPase subunit E
MSKLNDILRKEALADINRILDESDSGAESLIREAEKKASARLALHRKRIESEIRAANNRAQGAAELTVATARVQAKGQIIALVRKKTLSAIEELGVKSGYSQILTALADEAIEALDAAEVVVVNPNDTGIISDWAMQRRIEIQTDPELHLGVRLVSPSSRRSAENSLAERLDRIWDMLSARVAQILWR